MTQPSHQCPVLAKALKNAGVLGLPALQKFTTDATGLPFTLFSNPPLRALANESV